jgi:sulfane dehydrogenase subunit SoxC
MECGGNSAPFFSPTPIQADVQALHGLSSCAEWTGVKLSILLEECGVDPKAKWFVAEGADAPHLIRSVPLMKGLDDAMIALYQNGEPLMPGNGFPMRLVLPGFEGNLNIKFLRRIKLVPGPAMSFWESQVYTEPMPKGKSYNFTFINEVKSFITRPSPGINMKEPGIYEISGIAYSGRGKIAKVMVSADGGKSWGEAALQGPVMTKAFTRFRMPWRWNGGPAILQSRAWDDQGNFQPTRAAFVAERGQLDSEPAVTAFRNHHFNAVTSWGIASNGVVRHVYA